MGFNIIFFFSNLSNVKKHWFSSELVIELEMTDVGSFIIEFKFSSSLTLSSLLNKSYSFLSNNLEE